MLLTAHVASIGDSTDISRVQGAKGTSATLPQVYEVCGEPGGDWGGRGEGRNMGLGGSVEGSAEMVHLGFGCEVSQIVLASKVLDEGGLCGDVGGQPHRLAYIGNAGQQQEVARR